MTFQPSLGYVILYVASPDESNRFYQTLLGLRPIKVFQNFILFKLSNGILLGLWDRKSVQPPAQALAGAAELNFPADDVDALYEQWLSSGITIEQKPADMDFGRSFVASDPDGHRIRVYRLNAQRP